MRGEARFLMKKIYLDPLRRRKDVSQDPQMLQQDLEAQQDQDHASRKLRL